MARKSGVVTIAAEGRDKGKTFVVREMAADHAERWALRAFGAMARAGVEIPENLLLSGMAGLAAMGLKAFLAAPYEEVGPLLDEMMGCVHFRDEAAPMNEATGEPVDRALMPDDIEEVATRVQLRDEVFQIHTGFSVAASLLTAVAAILNSNPASLQMSQDESQPSLPLD
jgi:hypothetical protein